MKNYKAPVAMAKQNKTEQIYQNRPPETEWPDWQMICGVVKMLCTKDGDVIKNEDLTH